ncbi:MAG: PAS domain-containing protein, partial [Deltaproteobacteria bacterium]|nr:PAS domain-containing protein [Deltaproteobacteria bacterium]
IIGKTDADLWPADTARTLQEHDTVVLDMGQSIQVEESAEMADGLRHWLTLKFPIAGPARRLLGGMSVDITDHMKAETALRETHDKRIKESLALARTLSSALPLGARLQELCETTVELVECDRSSIFLRDGEYYRPRYNHGNPADIAATFSTFAIHHRHPLMAHVVEISGRVVIEHDTLHSPLFDAEVAKQARILTLMLVALWDDNGRPIGFLTAEYHESPGTFTEMTAPLLLGLARVAEMAIVTDRHAEARRQAEGALHRAAQDITDRKREQEEIERLNGILSQQVSELSDLTQELEAFSYSVSHDLRAPLRHIHGFVELLHKHAAAALDDKGRRYIEVITKSAKQMGQLIDDLLAFSRTTRTELRPTRVNLTHIVNEVVLDFAADTETHKIVWDISPLPDVYGDTALLRVVLTNLLGNAVKYTRPRGEARITIGTTTTAEHDLVCFVRDNGVGFDMRYVEKLFGVFQRLHRADEFEGTGIGLATVRRIVHRLGGHIWAEGEIDKGATFYFSLPLARKGTEDDAKQTYSIRGR